SITSSLPAVTAASYTYTLSLHDALPISNMQLPDVMGSDEAVFVKALRQAGCVLLGQTKAVEICLGITGHSVPRGTPWNPTDMDRSEEHTSELQSRENLVCRLLLEKTKQA